MDDPRNLWQSQEVEEMRISVDELRSKAAKFQSRIRWRNWREYGAAVVVIVWAGTTLWRTPHTVERIGFALIIMGSIYYMWHLKKFGAPKSLPADLGRADCARFYQSELARQRDLVRSIWKWAIGPMIPALALLDIYWIVVPPDGRRWFPVVGAVMQAVILVTIGWLNLRAARRLDGRIAELDHELGSM
jgi:hypothetical protein